MVHYDLAAAAAAAEGECYWQHSTHHFIAVFWFTVCSHQPSACSDQDTFFCLARFGHARADCKSIFLYKCRLLSASGFEMRKHQLSAKNYSVSNSSYMFITLLFIITRLSVEEGCDFVIIIDLTWAACPRVTPPLLLNCQHLMEERGRCFYRGWEEAPASGLILLVIKATFTSLFSAGICLTPPQTQTLKENPPKVCRQTTKLVYKHICFYTFVPLYTAVQDLSQVFNIEKGT